MKKQRRANLDKKILDFEQACRGAGLKLTHQRLEIFRELASAEDHPSAESLHKRLQKRLAFLSLDTVYRTLATLEKYQLISKVETVESQARYEVEMDRHHHAICRKCGTITDFRWNSFDEDPLPETVKDWGWIEKKNITVHGVCGKCTLTPP
ncbi:MAG: transcriptional repressor [Proteobacteria bacterium]|nr:transcriptional repressor [Desulfobulbaceae bacterium]MBU4151674.1 transcriptional repressor [Pseudomonadota bacterium]MDP2107410.1 Fur family transcriptional regulator [Desulfobulbaceae bacterium]